MTKKEILLIGSSFFVLACTIFWVKLPGSPKKNTEPVLSAQASVAPTALPTFDPKEANPSPSQTMPYLPEQFIIPIPTRVQSFGLSCEFAAASAILYLYTNNDNFAPKNEKKSEKLLISQMTLSNNPNIGIRMGETTPQDAQVLYDNLNKRFGGVNNYGIHAAPFIDFFNNYHLLAVPIGKDNMQQRIQQAIVSNHVIMTWIQIGKSQTVNVPLSYGQVQVVPGEHVVVINGYNKEGVQVMDPGIGAERSIPYEDLLLETNSFSMPFLEISKSNSSYFSLDTIVPFANALGLDRKKLKIEVINASGILGKGNDLAKTLLDFGYDVTKLVTQTDQAYEEISVKLRKEKKDYFDLLQKDLHLSLYTISSMILSDEISDPSVDATITIGN